MNNFSTNLREQKEVEYPNTNGWRLWRANKGGIHYLVKGKALCGTYIFPPDTNPFFEERVVEEWGWKCKTCLKLLAKLENRRK